MIADSLAANAEAHQQGAQGAYGEDDDPQSHCAPAVLNVAFVMLKDA